MAYGKCFLTGRFGPVERHHIFGGALRSKSERYGLVVELSPWMHREGPEAAHRCRSTAEELKRFGQRKVMMEQGWDVERFIREFGRNHLSDRELAEIAAQRQPQEKAESGGKHLARTKPAAGVRLVITAEVMPF